MLVFSCSACSCTSSSGVNFGVCFALRRFGGLSLLWLSGPPPCPAPVAPPRRCLLSALFLFLTHRYTMAAIKCKETHTREQVGTLRARVLPACCLPPFSATRPLICCRAGAHRVGCFSFLSAVFSVAVPTGARAFHSSRATAFKVAVIGAGGTCSLL